MHSFCRCSTAFFDVHFSMLHGLVEEKSRAMALWNLLLGFFLLEDAVEFKA